MNLNQTSAFGNGDLSERSTLIERFDQVRNVADSDGCHCLKQFVVKHNN